MITILQVILSIFCIFVLFSAFFKFKKRKIPLAQFIIWIIIWGLIFIGVIFPEVTTVLANILNVGRGMDALIYFSIIFLFYIIFQLYLKLEKMNREITKLVKEIALKEKKHK